MKTQLYNYRSGQQIVPDDIKQSVVTSIEGIESSIGEHDVRNFNKEFMGKLQKSGWSGFFPLSVYSKISITSENNRIGLCVQTGNVARIYADLLKLQTLFTDEKVKAGIIVVPTKECADSFGKNVANYERLLRELTYVFSKVITIPLLIVGFENS